MRTLRTGLAQLNLTVGGLGGNAKKIPAGTGRARRQGVSLLLPPPSALPA